MFRLAYTVAFIVLLWLHLQFTQTDHVMYGDVHVFKYNWVPWLFLFGMAFTPIGFAGVAHRLLLCCFSSTGGRKAPWFSPWSSPAGRRPTRQGPSQGWPATSRDPGPARLPRRRRA